MLVKTTAGITNPAKVQSALLNIVYLMPTAYSASLRGMADRDDEQVAESQANDGSN